MSSQYDGIIAKHYAAYRPALHETILDRCIPSSSAFSLGIDVGCGTGHSSIALVPFCKKVIGIDPSKSMIENSIRHSKVKYQNFDGQVLDFESSIADVITFAGSLFYAKSQQLLNEVVRVTKNNGSIFVYDFEIHLGDLLNELGFESTENQTYDHEPNFSGLASNSISLIKKKKEFEDFEILPANLAHLLLSVKEHYNYFEKRFEEHRLHSKLTDHLIEMTDAKNFKIGARLFYSVYTVSK